MDVKNQVQLITYPNSLGGSLKSLNYILNEYFPSVFKGGIHILPPFPSSGDRGFAPMTYLEIEAEFGDWNDLQILAETNDLMLDLMVNHISAQSVWFKDFLSKGRKSEFADLFLTLDKIWPDSEPVTGDIDKMFLRRTTPYSCFTISDTGNTEKVWTTFGKQDPSEQIDIDINSAITRSLLSEFLLNFGRNNVKFVRLDAVGYVIKKRRTSCFFVEPEIFQFLDWISELASSFGIVLLPELHANYTTQLKLADHGFWIYDFVLPYTILDTLIKKTSTKLCEYLRVRPHRQFTMLDCHDGIPVKPDMDELIDPGDARKLVNICLQRGANLSRILSERHKAEDGFDIHQIRGSYYSLLDCNDDAYLAARAIQFFTPGVPQVYYVGLLAGENDIKNVNLTGEGREINRQNFSVADIENAIKKPVVQRLLKLIRFRNEYPAFNGHFNVLDTEDNKIHLSWENDYYCCELLINLSTFTSQIKFRNEPGGIENYKI